MTTNCSDRENLNLGAESQLCSMLTLMFSLIEHSWVQFRYITNYESIALRWLPEKGTENSLIWAYRSWNPQFIRNMIPIVWKQKWHVLCMDFLEASIKPVRNSMNQNYYCALWWQHLLGEVIYLLNSAYKETNVSTNTVLHISVKYRFICLI